MDVRKFKFTCQGPLPSIEYIIDLNSFLTESTRMVYRFFNRTALPNSLNYSQVNTGVSTHDCASFFLSV